MSLATKLVTLRKQKGLTQLELAERLNVSRQAISRWEVGTAVPSTDNLKILGELYGVSVDYLLNDEHDNSVNIKSVKRDDDLPKQPDAGKRKIFINVVMFLVAVILSVAILSCFVWNGQNNEKQAVPLEDMATRKTYDYPIVTFPLN